MTTPGSLLPARSEALGTAIEVLRHNAQERESAMKLTAHEAESVLAVIVAATEMAKASHTQDQERRWAAWDAIDAALGI